MQSHLAPLPQRADPNCDCGHDHGGLDHSHTNVKLTQTLLGLIFVPNSFPGGLGFQRGTTVAGLSAMIGAGIRVPRSFGWRFST